MMAELDALEHHLGELLAGVDAAGRVRLAHELGRELRRSQARRIRANLNPDGSPFEPRKERPPLRGKSGRVKRKAGRMFRRMGQPDGLAWEASADGVSLGFANAGLQRIARVHQFGLRDRVSRAQGSPEATYPARGLLGLTEAERARILELVLRRLGRAY